MRDLASATDFGLAIARAGLAACPLGHDQEHIGLLEKAIADKAVICVQAKSDYEVAAERTARERKCRSKELLAPATLLDLASQVGVCEIKFRLSLSEWRHFEACVGGREYLVDLGGDRYEEMLSLRGRLRNLRAAIEDARSRVTKVLQATVDDHTERVKQIARGGVWDAPSSLDASAEDAEEAALTQKAITKLRSSQRRTQLPVSLPFILRPPCIVLLFMTMLCPDTVQDQLLGRTWPRLSLALHQLDENTTLPGLAALAARALTVTEDAAILCSGANELTGMADLRTQIFLTTSSLPAATRTVFLDCAWTGVSTQWLSLVHRRTQSQLLAMVDHPIVLLQTERRRIVAQITALTNFNGSEWMQMNMLLIPQYIRLTAATERHMIVAQQGEHSLVGWLLGLLTGDLLVPLRFNAAEAKDVGHAWLQQHLQTTETFCRKLWCVLRRCLVCIDAVTG
jgi:hypothetical protein